MTFAFILQCLVVGISPVSLAVAGAIQELEKNPMEGRGGVVVGSGWERVDGGG